jgi:hypothetical protein
MFTVTYVILEQWESTTHMITIKVPKARLKMNTIRGHCKVMKVC